MSKFITLGVLAAVVAGFAYYTLFWDQTSLPAPATEEVAVPAAADEAATTTEQEPIAGTGSLADLQARGEALECTITYTDPDAETAVEGTYFVVNEKQRGDFLTESPDLSGEILTSMIIADETMYTWTEIEGEQYGMQVDLTSMAESEVDANEPVPMDAAVEYTCTPWVNVDNTIFLPPSDVIFRDLSELMQGGMEYGTLYEEGAPNMPAAPTELPTRP